MKIYDDLKPLELRLSVLEVLAACLLGTLACSFWYLQILRADHYRVLSEENRLREAIIQAPRGLILDRNRRLIAENRPSFSIVLEREAIVDLQTTLEKIRRIPFLSVDAVVAGMNKFKSQPSFIPIVVKEDASAAEVAFIEARRMELPELASKVDFKRYYPAPASTAHVLGHVGEITESQLKLSSFKALHPGDLVGQAGLEKQYDAILRGIPGESREVVNSKGRKISELDRVEPRPGQTLTLTLDMRIMDAIEAAFKDGVGGAVMIDVKSGEVLAMISRPSFDPNFFTGPFSREEWISLISNPDHPLQNRAINNTYPAGSVFKLTVALGALSEKIITPDTAFFCPGYATIYGHTFHCWNAGGHGTVSLNRAISQSCNVYFYQVGKKLGIENIARYARTLGFGSPTRVDMPGEQPGLVPDPEWKTRTRGAEWYPGETISVAIGQGSLLVTPMQMAHHASIIASSGHVVRPHIARSWSDEGGQVFPYEASERTRTVAIAEAAFASVRQGMWGAVNDVGGTGFRARVAGRDVCGKTGTVQVASKANIRNPNSAGRELKVHSWFVGFAPFQNPEVALAVFVEHGGTGGEAAAPIARAALEAYFSFNDRSQASS